VGQLILRIALTGLLTGALLPAQEPEGESIVPPRFASAVQTALYDRVSSRLIAPCCWSQPVRLHQSEAASKVRMELISYIRGGMNESEIQDRFASEYGERILGQPRGARSLVAYVVPYICGAVGVFAMAVFLIGRSRRVHFALAAASPGGDLPELPDLE
jgi:cytochrome c-type biogenesis protein CcmH/NrfF